MYNVEPINNNVSLSQQRKLYSEEAEQSVLGGLLRFPDSLEKVKDILNPSHFYFNRNRIIYEAILDVEKNITKYFDPLIVGDYIEKKGDLELASGTNYILFLPESVPSAASIVNYSEIIVERSIERDLEKELISSVSLLRSHDEPNLRDKIQSGIINLQNIVDQSEKEVSDNPPILYDSLIESVKALDTRHQKGDNLLGATTGLKKLDELTAGLVDSDFIVIGARPSTGKTAFGINLMESYMMNHEGVAVVFSAEMPTDSIIQRLLASVSGVSAKSIKTGNLNDQDWPLLLSAVEKIKNKKLIIDDESTVTPDYIQRRLKGIEKQYGKVGIVLVDYLQLMSVPNFNQGKRLEITECSHALKATAKKYKCPVIALSQCTRDVDKRPDKRPTKADLMEAGAIEADADVIITLYADDVHNPETEHKNILEVIVCKNRNGEIGKVKAYFDRRIQKIKNLTLGDYNSQKTIV